MSDTQYIKDNLKGSVPTEIATEVIKNIVTQSIAFQVCNHTEMNSDKKKIPMLKDEGSAYWVGEGQSIGTSIQDWEYPELEARKIAVIIPCTKEKVEDSVLNVMGEIKEGISSAFIKAIDGAILFGTNSPFDTNIADTASHSMQVDAEKKLDILISDTLGLVEDEDLIPNAIIAPVSKKKELRNLRDANGNAVVVPGGVSGTSIYETPIYYPSSKSFDKSKAELLVGDFKKAMVGTRASINYEILDQATVDGINLAVNDMIAVKCTMRLGFKVLDSKAFAVLKANELKSKTISKEKVEVDNTIKEEKETDPIEEIMKNLKLAAKDKKEFKKLYSEAENEEQKTAIIDLFTEKQE